MDHSHRQKGVYKTIAIRSFVCDRELLQGEREFAYCRRSWTVQFLVPVRTFILFIEGLVCRPELHVVSSNLVIASLPGNLSYSTRKHHIRDYRHFTTTLIVL